MTDVALPNVSPQAAGEPEVASPNSVDPNLVEEYMMQRVEQYAGWYDRKSGPIKTRFL